MKKFVALLVMLVTGSCLLAQTPAPAPNTPPPATPAKPGAKPGAKPEVKKPEPEPKIEGYTIARANGTFLGLTVVEGRFHLKFYDKKKKPMKPDVDRALARWNSPQVTGQSRTVLNPIDANTLGGTTVIRGPLTFNVYLTLLKNEGDPDTNAETFVINFNG